MDYALGIEAAPTTVSGGTGILLLHPSTGETDRIDTQFLTQDTDAYLVISTRTTAREVQQKLDHYDLDETKATILDTLSVERGYSRRGADHIHYVSAPDDLEGIVEQVARFFDKTDGKRRVTFDSVTELAYYADEPGAKLAVERILGMLDQYDAVGLFHVSPEVHDEAYVEELETLFDGVIEITEDGSVSARF